MLIGLTRRTLLRPSLRRHQYRVDQYASTLAATSVAQLSLRGHLRIGQEVQHAINSGQPLVALESAIITHGMPRPDNLSLALELESIIRANGAVPATVAVIDGALRVGLTTPELTRLAEEEETVVKISSRDLGPAIALRRTGGTTCASTMLAAQLCNIDVFATGGLGGVHRGGEITMDISADLLALARTPICLVSAGVKSILDIGRTLEYLETTGVTVVTFGPDSDFPAFYTRKSGFQSPWNATTIEEAANVLDAHKELHPNTGMLLAVPIPAEYQEQGLALQMLVDRAQAELDMQNPPIRGKEVTPWLLNRLRELSGGSSLINNKALIKHSTLIAARLASQRADSSHKGILSGSFPATKGNLSYPSIDGTVTSGELTAGPRLMVVGAAAMDYSSRPEDDGNPSLKRRSTVPGRVVTGLGGVARNIAEAAHRSHSDKERVMLVSPLCNDTTGSLIRSEMRQIGMRLDGLIEIKDPMQRSAACAIALNSAGDLIHGVADMNIVRDLPAKIPLEILQRHSNNVNLVVVDGNVSPDAAAQIFDYSGESQVETFLFLRCSIFVSLAHGLSLELSSSKSSEPTSLAKCQVVLPALKAWAAKPHKRKHAVTYMSPNSRELRQLVTLVKEEGLMDSEAWHKAIEIYGVDEVFIEAIGDLAYSGDSRLSFLVEEEIITNAINLLPFFGHIFVTCGPRGVVLISQVPHALPQSAKSSRGPITSTGGTLGVSVYATNAMDKPSDIVSSTGAGDTFVGVMAAGLAEDATLMQDSRKLEWLIQAAQAASAMTLRSHHAVSPLIPVMW